MKAIFTAVISAMLVISAGAAEQAAPAPAKSSWSDFFKNMKTVLTQSAAAAERKTGRSAQAVAAVRGSHQDKKHIADPNEPGIKGDAKSAKAKRDLGYDTKLEASIDLLSKGKLDEGLKGLEEFKAAHPKHRTEDVDKSIEGAKAMIAEKNAMPAAEGALKP